MQYRSTYKFNQRIALIYHYLVVFYFILIKRKLKSYLLVVSPSYKIRVNLVIHYQWFIYSFIQSYLFILYQQYTLIILIRVFIIITKLYRFIIYQCYIDLYSRRKFVLLIRVYQSNLSIRSIYYLIIVYPSFISSSITISINSVFYI